MWRALNVAIRTPLLGPRAGPVSAGLPLASVARKHDAQQQGHAGTAVRVSCEAADWPAATDVLCWHCCHAFDGPPLPLPIKYDDRRDVFHVCVGVVNEQQRCREWGAGCGIRPAVQRRSRRRRLAADMCVGAACGSTETQQQGREANGR